MNDLKVLENSIFKKNVKITKTGLTIDEGTTYMEWVQIGKTLQGIGGAIHWWIGDWIRFGETHYGEKYTQAIEETGYDYDTLRHDVYVCNKVDLCRRRHNLSFSAHAEVAKLEPEEQEKWLDKAEKEEIGSKELRQAIKEHKVKNDRAGAIKDLDIRKGDFKKVLADIYDIDAIITDPPYAKEHIECYSDLSKYASQHMKKEGFLAAYSGQYNLPEVIKRLSNCLTYVWTFCLYHVGQKQLVNGVNIMCGWKPVLIFSNGCKKMRFSAYDVLISEEREKHSHEWQQSESGVKGLIEIFSKPGELVVDPFAGSGTFLKVANDLGRRGIGADL